MANRPTKEELAKVVRAYRANGLNVSETSRELGIKRTTLRRWLREYAAGEGLIEEGELYSDNGNTNRDLYTSARERKMNAYLRRKQKGGWLKPVLVRLPPGPFILLIFGDPHIDNDGFDVELFEEYWMQMDPEKRIYGVCVGDWFDNWKPLLAYLYQDNTTDPYDAWVLLKYWMENWGAGLIAGLAGNHDEWNKGIVDPVGELLRMHGTIYRVGAVRLAIQAGEAEPILVALRHKWRGSSMYSAAHGLKRAAMHGWNDDLLIGGHTHRDEVREYVHPLTKEISRLVQVSSFKRFDEYPDTQGLMQETIQPVVAVVIDPGRPKTDSDRIKEFRDLTAARCYLEGISKL